MNWKRKRLLVVGRILMPLDRELVLMLMLDRADRKGRIKEPVGAAFNDMLAAEMRAVASRLIDATYIPAGVDATRIKRVVEALQEAGIG